MPIGDKSAYTDKQKRKAEHIEESYEKRGLSAQEAKSRAWATVNRQDGGGKASGAGRKKATKKTPTKTSTRTPTKTARRRPAARKEATKKATSTRSTKTRATKKRATKTSATRKRKAA